MSTSSTWIGVEATEGRAKTVGPETTILHLATNEALRAAQLDLLTAPLVLHENHNENHEFDARHPFHWAAFQVIGDWR